MAAITALSLVPRPFAADPVPAAWFDYAIRPAHGKWEIRVGDSGRRFVYASLEDAANVALGAAKLHWATRREPCGATLHMGAGRVRTLVSFGG
jgi:hypothetical protein